MRIRTGLLSAFAIGAILAAPLTALAEEDDNARAARWQDLQHMILSDKPLQDGTGIVALEAPERALDAALVPIKITLGRRDVQKLYIVVDDNPSPLAGNFTFGPAADTHEIRLRVRVDAYTYIHAVAETADGHLYATQQFVKAAGGCSAPASGDPQLALAHLGQMKLKAAADGPAGIDQLQLLVSHPNFNGMQMDQVTRNYTPARYIQQIEVKTGGKLVFDLAADISLSSDPAITFGIVPQEGAPIAVEAVDSTKADFRQSFELPTKGT